MLAYTREELLQHRNGAGCPSARIPEEIWRATRRGKKAGSKVRERIERDRRFKPFLPSIIMGNVWSLANKTDELAALVNGQRIYRESSLLILTETWLQGITPDSVVDLTGFTLVRADRWIQSGKKRGGGLAVYVNSKWCCPGHVTVKEITCTPDVELLAVGLRPYYLPREFSHTIAVAVYILPSAAAPAAIAGLQTRHPSALILISGGFNHVSLSPVLTTFTQYVDCPTRENKILDLLYANVKGAYSSSSLPPLGASDHNLIHLGTTYRPLVEQQTATIKTVKVWSKDTEEALQECFSVTDWNVFKEDYGEDIEGLSLCITEYIRFCEDNIVQTKKIG